MIRYKFEDCSHVIPPTIILDGLAKDRGKPPGYHCTCFDRVDHFLHLVLSGQRGYSAMGQMQLLPSDNGLTLLFEMPPSPSVMPTIRWTY
ncbi:hypothetical protein SUGI_0293780 [Cryptomeria japonica]|nr:hypothetical protein SUGI_0293780 [Cryptomeria japonica]